VTLLLQPLIDESRAFADELPAYVEDGRTLLEDNSDLYARLQSGAQSASADPTILLGGVLEVGQGLVGAVTTTFVVVVFTIYILLDGTRIYAWLVRYARADTRDKLDRTIPEVIKVINGYVVGQLFTSAVFGVFTFALLSLLDVPQPLFLAVVADAIPIAGVIIATVPAVLLALTVSPMAAVAVLVAYLVYQQIENYVIVPRVYRSTLQISSFAVLVAVLIGGTLLGVLGVLLALPAAAAVPAIEKIWVPEARRRKADAVEHERIAHAEEPTAGWPG
jgi:predicted PurR-regulated permease PerM